MSVIHHAHVAWTSEMRRAILELCTGDVHLAQLCAAEAAVGEAFAHAAIHAAEAAGWKSGEIDAIASHGQTIWHQPIEAAFGGMQGRGTRQIGSAAVISAMTGVQVVSNFRAADMAAGGQGAPLVPFLDFQLCRSEEHDVVALNIGGIANVTFIPRSASMEQVVAFDTGPGCMILDWLATELYGEPYDSGGETALSGICHVPILESLCSDPYFDRTPPKSTGREYFGAHYARALLNTCAAECMHHADIMATAAEFTARTIASAIIRYWPGILERQRFQIYSGGGGARNKAIMRGLARSLDHAEIRDYGALGISGESREAAAFALLAYETLHGRPSVIPSATGARYAAIAGDITPRPHGG